MFGFRKKRHACLIMKFGQNCQFRCDGKTVLAPNGEPACADDDRLAEAIKAHIEAHGAEMTGASDILSWHYTYQCNFKQMGRARVAAMLTDCFLVKTRDITFVLGEQIKQIASLFGTEASARPKIESWLDGLSVRQLTAACCIGNAYHSINLALFMAAGVADGWKRMSKRQLAEIVGQIFQSSVKDVLSDIDLFEFYFTLTDPEVDAKTTSSGRVPWKDAHGKYRCAGDDCPPGLCESGRCPLDICTKATFNMQAGDYRGAIDLFKKGLSIAPDYANGWTNLAACYGNLGDHNMALVCAKRALKADPDYAPAKQIVAVASQKI